MNTEQLINQLQQLADERNWYIAQRDKMIERHQLQPQEGLFSWCVNLAAKQIRQVDSRIADVHRSLHREQLSVMEALGV